MTMKLKQSVKDRLFADGLDIRANERPMID